jgi:[acyl-carrier-protein] S-malonyltransferase
MKTAFLFPGQGAQHLGMGRDISTSSPAAKVLFDRASAILGYDLLDLCLNGPVEKLNTTAVSQPAIFVASLASLETLRNTTPAAFDAVTDTAGLSLGEYTALVFAEALSFENAVHVVKARGEAMQAAAEATAGGMVAVLGLEATEVEPLVAEARGTGTLEIANLLCPGNTVVSGSAASVDALCALAESKQFRTARLTVAGAFHTNLMKPADDVLAAALAKVKIASPRIPVWSNVDGLPHTDGEEIRGLLVKQVLSPVQWEATQRGLLAAGVEKFYEIGPGKVLAGLMKRVHRKADFTNVLA